MYFVSRSFTRIFIFDISNSTASKYTLRLRIQEICTGITSLKCLFVIFIIR